MAPYSRITPLESGDRREVFVPKIYKKSVCPKGALCIRTMWCLCFWLAGKDVCAVNSKFACGLLLGGVAETIKMLGYPYGFETCAG